MLGLTINMRFASRAPSGVDRVAGQLLKAIADVCCELEEDCSGISVVYPKCGINRGYYSEGCFYPLRNVLDSKLNGHVWEQIELPFRVGESWLLNFCSLGPAIRRRQVVMIHDAQTYLIPQSYTFLFRCWYKIMLPILGRRSDVILTVSNYSKEQLERFKVVPKGKAHVVPNGVDHFDSIVEDECALQRFGLLQNNYVLVLGSLAPHKNLSILLQLYNEGASGMPELVVAGGINNAVFSKTSEIAAPKVRFLGRVSDAELKSLYRGSIAFVFPSLTEGFGLPPLEAMHCGCPVIATTEGAVPEVLGGAALYVNPRDKEGWRSAIMQIADSPELQKSLSNKGRSRSRLYTWRRSALSVLRILATYDKDYALIDKLNNLGAHK